MARKFLFLLAASVMIASSTSATATTRASVPKSVMDYVNSQGAKGFNGVILVARSGSVWTRAYGLADREFKIPNTPATKFRIGSLTKQFTAAAIMLLQQDGKLSLRDPICRYVSPCPQSWQPIVIEQLLDHSSGIPDFVRLPEMRDQFTRPMNLEGMIAVLASHPLDFTPGTDAHYGNSGLLISAFIIQKLSGLTYAEFMKKRVFDPLGMHSSGYAYDAPIIPLRARGYVRNEGRFENAPYIDMSIPIGAGSQYSTVGDLYRWDRALTRPGLLDARSLASMFVRHQGDFGLGWEVTEENGRRVVEHNGDINGFGAFIARYPDDDAVIIVLTNLEKTKVRQIKDEIASRLFAGR